MALIPDTHKNPYDLFSIWMAEAEASEPEDPNAMALSTVSADGFPSCRMVLLKAVDERGFVFYTNSNSRKGQELKDTRKAALCFHWKSLYRQIRIEGDIEIVSEAESDAYFASRSRLSRIGAWASQQSQLLDKPLQQALDEVTPDFPDGADVPRPPHWNGYRVIPRSIEFWQQGEGRLHDRLVYKLNDDSWEQLRLYP